MHRAGAGGADDADASEAGGTDEGRDRTGLARATTPEVQRRAIHASGATAPLAYVAELVGWRQLGVLLAGATAVALALEAGRLSGRLRLRIFERLTREYEREGLAGYALYFIGMTTTAWVFPPRVAVPGMLMLAIGDPVSGLLSSGQLRTTKRSWVLAAMFGVCTLLAAPFVPPLLAICGGLAATIADGVKPMIAGYVIDDNLTIAPAAATTITAVGWAAGRLGVPVGI